MQRLDVEKNNSWKLPNLYNRDLNGKWDFSATGDDDSYFSKSVIFKDEKYEYWRRYYKKECNINAVSLYVCVRALSLSLNKNSTEPILPLFSHLFLSICLCVLFVRFPTHYGRDTELYNISYLLERQWFKSVLCNGICNYVLYWVEVEWRSREGRMNIFPLLIYILDYFLKV